MIKPSWLLLLIVCGVAPAKAAPWLTEKATALSWKAVEDDNQGFYLLWTHQEPAGLRVLGQHVTPQRASLWNSPGQTMLPVISDTSVWTAFADSRQGLVLTWMQEGKILVQRWTPDGAPVWKTSVQVSDTRFMASDPAGVADGGGGFYLVWKEKVYADRAVLMAQHLNAQARPIWPTAIRVSLRPSDQRQPAVVFDGAAGMIIAWADTRDFASDWRVQRINFQGFRLWGLEGIPITSPAGTGSSGLRMAPWGQGSLTVAWVDAQQGHSRVVDLQINPQGIPIANKKFNEVTSGDQWNPVLTGDGTGHYWVGWEDNRNGQNWQIYLRHDGADIALSTLTAGDQGKPALVQDGTQGLFTVWQENRKSSPSLYAQHLTRAGEETWEKGGRELAAGLKHPDTPTLLLLDAEHAAVIWADRPTQGEYALYWQLL